VRVLRIASVGVIAWVLIGLLVAVLLAILFGKWSNAFAISGLVLMLGSVGWTLGPFKTPMAWSEGALMAYQGNTDTAPSSFRRRRRVLAVPAFALTAGALLLGVAGVIAGG